MIQILKDLVDQEVSEGRDPDIIRLDDNSFKFLQKELLEKYPDAQLLQKRDVLTISGLRILLGWSLHSHKLEIRNIQVSRENIDFKFQKQSVVEL